MILLLILLSSIHLVATNCVLSRFNLKNQSSFILDSFNSFAELDFKTCGTTHMLAMSIIPNSQLVLDDSLNFAGLKIESEQKSFVVAFLNLRGINIEADVFKEIAILSFSKKLAVSLTDSNFEFYYKNNRIDDMI